MRYVQCFNDIPVTSPLVGAEHWFGHANRNTATGRANFPDNRAFITSLRRGRMINRSSVRIKSMPTKWKRYFSCAIFSTTVNIRHLILLRSWVASTFKTSSQRGQHNQLSIVKVRRSISQCPKWLKIISYNRPGWWVPFLFLEPRSNKRW